MTCQTCRYYDGPDQGTGRCELFATLSAELPAVFTLDPAVEADGRCDAYQPREADEGRPERQSRIGPPARYKAAAEGQWITIGARQGGDGKRHGGSPVFVQGGRIVKGHPGLTGKKLGAFHEPAEQGGHRKQLNQGKEYDRAKWAKTARAEGVDPQALHQLAGEMLAHDREFAGDKTALLQRARGLARTFDVNLSNLSRAFRTGDAANVPHLDEVADALAHEEGGRFHPYLGDDPTQGLMDLLREGNPEGMSEEDAYRQALDHLKGRQEEEAGRWKVRDDEEVPFSRIGPPVRYAANQGQPAQPRPPKPQAQPAPQPPPPTTPTVPQPPAAGQSQPPRVAPVPTVPQGPAQAPAAPQQPAKPPQVVTAAESQERRRQGGSAGIPALDPQAAKRGMTPAQFEEWGRRVDAGGGYDYAGRQPAPTQAPAPPEAPRWKRVSSAIASQEDYFDALATFGHEVLLGVTPEQTARDWNQRHFSPLQMSQWMAPGVQVYNEVFASELRDAGVKPADIRALTDAGVDADRTSGELTRMVRQMRGGAPPVPTREYTFHMRDSYGSDHEFTFTAGSDGEARDKADENAREWANDLIEGAAYEPGTQVAVHWGVQDEDGNDVHGGRQNVDIPGDEPEEEESEDDEPEGEESEDSERAAPATLPRSLAEAGESKARYRILHSEQHVRRNLGAALGHDDPAVVPSLVGAPDEATVSLSPGYHGGASVNVVVRHPDIQICDRTIDVDDHGETHIHNDNFEVVHDAPDGLGLAVFARQVENARKAGVSYIGCHAAGAGDGTMDRKHGKYVGYYVWPLFGYDYRLEDMSGEMQRKVRQQFPNARSVLDVFDAEGGKEWWYRHGAGLPDARFDLFEGSRSLHTLEKYLANRAARAPGEGGRGAGKPASRPPTVQQGAQPQEDDDEGFNYFDSIAASWGSGDRRGAMFYNFARQGRDPAFLREFLPVVEDEIAAVKRPSTPGVSVHPEYRQQSIRELSGLRDEVRRRLGDTVAEARFDESKPPTPQEADHLIDDLTAFGNWDDMVRSLRTGYVPTISRSPQGDRLAAWIVAQGFRVWPER